MNDTIGPIPKIDPQYLAKQLVERADDEGANLVDPDGMLTKFWLSVLTEINNRGVGGRVLGGLRRPEGPVGLDHQHPGVRGDADLHPPPDPQHFPLCQQEVWDALAGDLKPIYTAVNEPDAAERFDDFTETWGQQYPVIIQLWRASWSEFIPFLDYDQRRQRRQTTKRSTAT